MGEVLKPFQHDLDVPEIVQEIRQDDHVEALTEVQVVNVSHDERQPGVLRTGPQNHLGREVHADAEVRIEGGQEVPGPAAKLEDPSAGRDEEPIGFDESSLVSCSQTRPAFEAPSNRVPMRQTRLSVGVLGPGQPGVSERRAWRSDEGPHTPRVASRSRVPTAIRLGAERSKNVGDRGIWVPLFPVHR